jgi:adenylate cyclase
LGALAGVLMVVVFWAYNFYILAFNGVFLPIVWPTIASLLTFTGAVVYRYYIQDREKWELTRVFSKFVSPQVMGKILADPGQAMETMKGSRKELTVLFADIHNFTNHFEDAEPEQIVHQLNEYFNIMTRIVLNHGGTYDKYMGDALMAFFGSPTELPDHAERACRAALEMSAALEPLNQKWVQEGRPRLRHGIGISTGPVFVGYFGSDEIKNFTVIGSNVNLGARLETYTRQVDSDILISKGTYERVKTWARTRDLGEIPIKGFSNPVQAYVLEGDDGGMAQ